MNTKKLSIGSKFQYALYDFGYIGLSLACNTYLLIYLTTIGGMSALLAPVAMALGRFLAAVTGPVEGVVIESTNTKMGRYRTWILLGTLIYFAASLALFTNWGAQLSETIQFAAVTFLYWLWGVGADMAYIPFITFNSILTQDPQERVALSKWRNIGTSTVKILTGYILLPLVYFFGGTKDYTAKGMFWMIFSCGALLLICLISVMELTKPYKDAGIAQSKGKAVKVPLKEQLKLFGSSRALAGIFIAEIFRNIYIVGAASLWPYFFTYVIGNTDMLPVYLGSAGIAMLLGTLIGPSLTKKLSKKACYIGASIFSAFCFTLMYLTAENAILAIACGCAATFAVALPMTLVTAMYADLGDFIYWKTKTNARATINSLYMISIKIGATITYLIIGAGLAAAGFSAGAEITAQTVNGLRILCCIAPASMLLLSAVSLLLYNIKEKDLPQMQQEIAQRETAM